MSNVPFTAPDSRSGDLSVVDPSTPPLLSRSCPLEPFGFALGGCPSARRAGPVLSRLPLASRLGAPPVFMAQDPAQFPPNVVVDHHIAAKEEARRIHRRHRIRNRMACPLVREKVNGYKRWYYAMNREMMKEYKRAWRLRQKQNNFEAYQAKITAYKRAWREKQKQVAKKRERDWQEHMLREKGLVLSSAARRTVSMVSSIAASAASAASSLWC